MTMTARALSVSAAAAVMLSLSGMTAMAGETTLSAPQGSTEERVAMLLRRLDPSASENCVAKAVKPGRGVCVVDISCGGPGARAARRASSLSEEWWALCADPEQPAH